MVTLYGVTMKPFRAHGHATAKRDRATQPKLQAVTHA
jgi:hypothetical protein